MPALLASLAYFLVGWLVSWPMAGHQPLPVAVQFWGLALVALVVAGAALLSAEQRGFTSRLMLTTAITLFTLTYALHWPAFYRIATHPDVHGELFLAFVIVGPMVLTYASPAVASFRTR